MLPPQGAAARKPISRAAASPESRSATTQGTGRREPLLPLETLPGFAEPPCPHDHWNRFPAPTIAATCPEGCSRGEVLPIESPVPPAGLAPGAASPRGTP